MFLYAGYEYIYNNELFFITKYKDINKEAIEYYVYMLNMLTPDQKRYIQDIFNCTTPVTAHKLIDTYQSHINKRQEYEIIYLIGLLERLNL